MKNTNSSIPKTTLDRLTEIAKNADCAIERRGDLETRNNDSEDFFEVSVWGIRRMLEEAYRLGREGK